MYYHTGEWSLSGPESHSVYQILYTYSSIALSNEMSKNSMLPQLKPYPRLQQIKRAGQLSLRRLLKTYSMMLPTS